MATTQYVDIVDYIDMSGCEGLNLKTPGMVRRIFDDDDFTLDSDVDPEMLVSIRFLQPMKIYSLRLWGSSDTSTYPKDMKLFVNRSNMDFNDAHGATAAEIAQPMTLKPSQGPDTAEELKTRFVKFQNVSSLTIFISHNHGASHTSLRRLQLIGQPKEVMDMNKFERKKG